MVVGKRTLSTEGVGMEAGERPGNIAAGATKSATVAYVRN
jgi:hypothetical protein